MQGSDDSVDRLKHQHLEAFLQPTDFCDSEHESIEQAALNIIHGCHSHYEEIQKLFYWVRDGIKYEVGLVADTASQTLQKGVGSCTNKSNLLVALLRSLGHPAGFHLMRVKTRLYFGPLVPQRFHRFGSKESCHTYVSAMIDGHWVKLDPSDDVRLSNATQHLCRQGRKVEFDGRTDAILNLDPAHVVSDSEVMPSLDSVFTKQRKVPDMAIHFFNLYMDFLRRHCIVYSHIDAAIEGYFDWLKIHDPDLLNMYLVLESNFADRLAAKPVDSPAATDTMVPETAATAAINEVIS